MGKFKKGDKVRCIDSHGWHGITVGKVYEVAHDSDEAGVSLVSDDRGRFNTPVPRRFELATPSNSYSVHNDSFHSVNCGAFFTIDEATAWIQENGTAGETYTVVERIERRKFEVVEKVQRELKAL